MNEYTLFWADGKREVIKGESLSKAMNEAGYATGTLQKLSLWTHGDYNGCIWDVDKGWQQQKDVTNG